jgi:hypothetical protein
MKSAAFLPAEIVAFIIQNQIDDGALGQVRWFIEYQPAVLDVCSKTTHSIQSRVPGSTDKLA